MSTDPLDRAGRALLHLVIPTTDAQPSPVDGESFVMWRHAYDPQIACRVGTEPRLIGGPLGRADLIPRLVALASIRTIDDDEGTDREADAVAHFIADFGALSSAEHRPSVADDSITDPLERLEALIAEREWFHAPVEDYLRFARWVATFHRCIVSVTEGEVPDARDVAVIVAAGRLDRSPDAIEAEAIDRKVRRRAVAMLLAEFDGEPTTAAVDLSGDDEDADDDEREAIEAALDALIPGRDVEDAVREQVQIVGEWAESVPRARAALNAALNRWLERLRVAPRLFERPSGETGMGMDVGVLEGAIAHRLASELAGVKRAPAPRKRKSSDDRAAERRKAKAAWAQEWRRRVRRVGRHVKTAEDIERVARLMRLTVEDVERAWTAARIVAVYRAATPRPSLATVAASAGVDSGTVRAVLNGLGLLKAKR